MRNADAPWGSFDPAAYIERNYRDVQAEDTEILRLVRDHFVAHFRTRRGGPVLGIDVGAGANLYPAFTMLPWCDEITLFECSPANLAYLRSQLQGIDGHWDQFWEILREDAAYASLDVGRRGRLRDFVTVQQGSLFDLERPAKLWSLGTMFFVAESMTTSHDEFYRAVRCFMRALAPGAPFAAAFMAHSQGYHVGEHFFPACAVGETDVYDSLEPFADDFEVVRLLSPAAVREGYSGMIVALGRRGSHVLPVQ